MPFLSRIRSAKNVKSERDKINIKFYSKPGCSLCDKARDLIRDFEAMYPLEIEEINILSSLGLYEKYKHSIPVIVIDDTHSFVSRIDRQEVEKVLRTLSANTKTKWGKFN